MSGRRFLAALLLSPLTLSPALGEPLPDLDAWRARVEAAEALAQTAQHTGRVTMRMQNELTHQIYQRALRCDDATSSLLARQRHLGHTYRDLLQAWRIEVDQIGRDRELTVLAPLLQPEDHGRIRRLESRLDEELLLWRTTVQWQQVKVEPWAGVCGAVLRPDEGLPPWADHLPAEGPTLVIGVGPGRICPVGVEAAGAVVLVEEGRACVALVGCDCAPQPVTDGAVLSAQAPSDPAPSHPNAPLPSSVPEDR